MTSQLITIHNQQHSPLLRLPPELRNRIYNFTLTGHDILVRKGFRGLLFHSRPHSPNTNWPQGGNATLGITALHYASRQLRYETAGTPFRLNRFVRTGAALTQFISLSGARAEHLTSVGIQVLHCDEMQVRGQCVVDGVLHGILVVLRRLASLRRVSVEWPARVLRNYDGVEAMLAEVREVVEWGREAGVVQFEAHFTTGG